MPDNTIENFADLVAEVDTLRTNTEASFTQVNASLNGIEFRIENGLLQYRYPESEV